MRLKGGYGRTGLAEQAVVARRVFRAAVTDPLVNAGSPARAKNPIRPAAIMIKGNGIAKKKIATNAAAASACMGRLFSARRPTRIRASTTTASTAAFRPKNARHKATSPHSA